MLIRESPCCEMPERHATRGFFLVYLRMVFRLSTIRLILEVRGATYVQNEVFMVKSGLQPHR